MAEFVEYFALLKDMPPGQVPRAVAAAIEHVGLGDKARAKLRTLSGGMLRRVGIAQAIVNEPELLLLDEPTAGLDPEQRVAFRALLRELGQRATVVVSTHLVEDVGAACTEVALMDAGKIVFHGTPDELTARGEGSGAVGDAPLERGYSAVLAAPVGRRRGHDRDQRAVRHRPARVVPAGPADPARLLRIELRRNAMPLDPAADRRAVLVRLLPAEHGPAAAVGAAHVLEHGPGPHDHRLRAVRGGRGGLDGFAGRPARHGRPGDRRARPRWVASSPPGPRPRSGRWAPTWCSSA